jgi:bifunctional DNA-binding transcriptional regulator/antitoxin component of YhaV-PrlF toxin-antitoxin module
VPAAVRRLLGPAPGESLEWIEEDGRVVVRRVVQHDSVDLHRALFSEGTPAQRSLADLKAGIADRMRRKHARD